MRGLEKEAIPHDRDDFLRAVHDIELADSIKPDPVLLGLLRRLRCPTWVFTASVASHAQRCIACLGVESVRTIAGIIDVRAVNYATKYELAAYRAAESIAAGVSGGAAGVTAGSSAAANVAAGGGTDGDGIHSRTGARTHILVDDSWSNMKAAKAAGWRTVLVGRTARDGRSASECEFADCVIGSIHELPSVLPELFEPVTPAM